MNAGQKSARRIAVAAELNSICSSCRHQLIRRRASTAAATSPSPIAQTAPPPPVTSTKPKKAYRLLASPVLSRPPLLTRALTPFEKAFYLYQKRLNERLALPFGRYFYYKSGTPQDEEWKRQIRARKTPSRDIGVYTAYGEEGWNDEVLVGDDTAEVDKTYEALVRDAEGRGGEELKDGKEGEASEAQRRRELQKREVQRPMPRITEADENGDLTSLNRKFDRTLYLVVKNKEGRWRFPEDRVWGREDLHNVSIPHLSAERKGDCSFLDAYDRPPSASSSSPAAST
jgi:large subunit ribosomal protein L46